MDGGGKRVTSSVLNYLHFLPLSRVALSRMNSMIGAGVGAPLSVRMSRGSPVAADHPGGRRSVADPFCFSGFPPSVRPSPRKKLRCGFRSFLISCESSRGSSGGRPGGDGEGTDVDYLPASLLVAETASHYRILQQGYQEEVKWPISRQFHPFSLQTKGLRTDSALISPGFLNRFPSPTIFLKITCDADFVLPIIVGEYSIEKLINAFQGDGNQDCLDQFQLVKDLPEKFGFKIEMVRITERVVNTYFARLYFSKPGKGELFSVDARPSDAINIAYRCQIPVYVNKQIIQTDAIRIGYSVDQTRDAKPVYDISLDSAPEGPDVLMEELDLVRSMNLAIKEERYIDAAMWRDKLMRIRKTKT